MSVVIALSMVLSGVVIISGREDAAPASGTTECVLIDTTRIDVKGALATGGINVIEDYGSFVMAEVNGAQKRQFTDANLVTELPDLYTFNYNQIEFDVRDGPPTDTLMSQAPIDEFQQDYYFVKMFGPVKDEWKAEIELTGAEIYSAIPVNGFLVKMDAGQRASVEANPHVLWVGHFDPAYKVAPEVAASEGDFRVNIITFPQQREAVMARLAKLLAQTNTSSIVSTETCDLADGAMGLIAATMDARTANTVASLPGVMRVEKWEPSYQCNDIAHSLTQSLGSTAVGAPSSLVAGSYGSTVPVWNRGIFGTGQVIGGADTGIRCDHNMFRDTSVSPPYNSTSSTHRKIIRYYPGYWNNWDTPITDPNQDNPDDHGTHIAGSVAGYDNPVGGTSAYDGMAPGAKISFCDVGIGDPDGYVYPPNDYSLMWDPAVELDGARIFYQSWVSGYQSSYTSDNAVIDRYIWDHPQLLMLWPSGGSGDMGVYTVGNQASSKNVMAIGSSGTSTNEAAASVASFSSRGPTYDNRLKPDILTPGMLIASADGDGTTGYVVVPGTSMSTGIAAGSASLAVEYFMAGYYPTGSKVAGNSFDPSAALIKAVLANSAEESTTYTNPYRNYYNTGTTGSWPSVNQGWGRMCLDSALYFTGDAGSLQVADCDRGLGTGEYVEYKYSVTANTAPLRISMCWNDYPAMPGAGIALVNDLNLLVTSPSGTQYKGNVFSGSNPASSLTGGSYDARNNVEHFRLPSSSALLETGVWTVRVTALNVQCGPQPFALAVNGALDLDYGKIQIDQAVYSEAGTAQVRIEDTGAGAGPLTAHAYCAATGDWETVTCTQSGTGTYLGSMAFTLNAVSKNNSALTVRDGDLAVFFYDDVTGMAHRSYANATIDAAGPVITNIRAEEISHVSALIKWTNSENANGTVYYGTTTSLGLRQEEATPFAIGQELALSGLAPDTLYYYDVESWDMYGHRTRATNGGSHYTFRTTPIGDVLVVIGDDEGFNVTFIEECYATALSAKGWTHNFWKCYLQGTPSLTELQSYKAVVWQVGIEEYPPFDAGERTLIKNYNDGGGRLWVNSHDVAWAFGDATGPFYSLEAYRWLQGQLKVAWQADPATWGSTTGVSGDPISGAYTGGIAYYPIRDGAAGDEINSVAAGGTANYVWRSTDGSADDIAVRWESSAANGTAGVGTWGGTQSRIVTYCFEWFRLSSTTTSNVQRTDILDKTIIWLLGRDHPDMTVIAPNGGETINTATTPISWTRTTYGGTSVLNTTLSYSPDNGQTWHLITTLTPGTSPYIWTVSGLPNGNQYRVKVEVRDSGAPAFMGSDESDGTFTITSGTDNMGPNIVPGSQVARPIPVVIGQIMWFNATIDDTTKGNSPIAGAEFFVDGTGAPGTGTAMSAVDFSFNSVIEAVTWSGVCALTEGEHVLRMRGRDATGYWGILENITFQVIPGAAPPSDPYEIPLTGKAANSWVFVSFPSGLSGNILTVLNDATKGDGFTTWSKAKWYDGTTKIWKSFSSAGAQTFTNIDNTMGVWLWLTANGGDQALTLSSYAAIPASTGIQLYAGWNMVGYPCANPSWASATLPAEADMVSVYSNVTPFVQDYSDLSAVTMSHGNAYWVHVTADCTWTIQP